MRFLLMTVMLSWALGPGGVAAQAPMGSTAPPLAADPALEARVLVIAEELRCLVCQNETIAASQADLAKDLRQQIREQLTQGRTQAEILDFMAQRYGDFVLYRPPLKFSTVLLWVGPFVLLLVAAGVLLMNIRRRDPLTENAPLTPAELQRAQRLLDDAGGAP
jgi:cytochrome c-type biogenesis protein CcmH